MSQAWSSLGYGEWSATCDALHAHTQVLGKLAVALAPPEPALQHAALRLTARGWQTLALPAPDGPGAPVLTLVRSGRHPVLRRAGRPPVRGLHHAQRHGRRGGGSRLVAGRSPLRQACVLRLRAPEARRVRGR